MSHVFDASSVSSRESESTAAAACAAAPNSASTLIHITQYINPHLFWFKSADDVNFGNRQLQALELDIAQYALQSDSRLDAAGYQPQVGETVAVRYLVWDKWIRAVVDEVLQFYDGSSFVLWTVDHGTSIESKPRHIRPLSAELATRPIQSVYRGGLASLLPTELRHDHATRTTDTHRSDTWDDWSVRQTEDLLNDATEIAFTATLIVEDEDRRSDPHYFGTVQLLMPAGCRVNVAQMLQKERRACAVEPAAFAESIADLRSRRVLRWHDNRNNAVVRRNEVTTGGCGAKRTAVGRAPNVIVDEMEKKYGGETYPVAAKITDWIARNPLDRAPEEGGLLKTGGATVFCKSRPPLMGTASVAAAAAEAIPPETTEESGLLKTCAAAVLHKSRPPLRELAAIDVSAQAIPPESLPEPQSLSIGKTAPPIVAGGAYRALRARLQRLALEKKNSALGLEAAISPPLAAEPKITVPPPPVVEVSVPAPVNAASSAIGLSFPNPLIARLEMRNRALRAMQQPTLTAPKPDETTAEERPKLVCPPVPRRPQPQHQLPQPQHQLPQPQHQLPQPQHQLPQPQHQLPQPQHQLPQPRFLKPIPVAAAPKPQAATNVKYAPAGFALKDLHTIENSSSELRAAPLKAPMAMHLLPRFQVSKSKSATHSLQATTASSEQCIKNSLHLHRVLVHGVNRPEPLESVQQASFTDTVHAAIRRARYTELYRTQAYTWPHLLRGNSVMLINGAGCGKTIAYLPAICSQVQELYTDGRVPRNTVGPVAVILCLSARIVARVAKLARLFMANTPEWPVVEAFGCHDTRRIRAELLNGCALLVATPPCWHRLMRESRQPLIDGRRLRFLALDDLDLIMERFMADFTATYTRMAMLNKHHLQQLGTVLPAGSHTCGLQLVVTARRWRRELDYFFRAGKDLVLVMGAYAEAAAYARSTIQLQRLAAGEKLAALTAALRARDCRQQATVVVCNEASEAILVAMQLSQELVNCVVYHERNGDRELAVAKHWARSFGGAVLVCTDATIADLRLERAQNVVHYSIPHTWTAFAYRCSSSFGYYEDFVRNADAVKMAPHSLILMDERNNVQLPRLIEFMRGHGVPIEPAVQQLCERIRREAEETRCRAELVPFCAAVLLVGECDASGCQRRHLLSAADGTEVAAMPAVRGSVRMVVLRVVTPTEYWVRVVETRAPGQREWRRVEGEYLCFSIEMGSFYAREENRRAMEGEVRVGSCAVIEEKGGYHRCRVMGIKKSRLSTTVELHLIDSGQLLSACRPTELLHLDERFRRLPAQSICVRIANCVPCDGDTEWEACATKAAQDWLQNGEHGSGSTEHVHLEGRIEFTVLNTLWLDSLRLIVRLPSLSKSVHLLSVRNELVRLNYGVLDKRATVELRQQADRAGLDVGGPPVGVEIVEEKINEDVEEKLIDADTEDSVDDQQNAQVSHTNGWATLNENCVHRVIISAYYSPDSCYVQLDSSTLQNVYDAIDLHMADLQHTESIPPPVELICNAFCLAPLNDQYHRARICSIEPELRVEFLDSGNASPIANASDLLEMPQSLLLVAPFQAIECRLVGIQPAFGEPQWSTESGDRIYDEVLGLSETVLVRSLRSLECGGFEAKQAPKYDVVMLDEEGEAMERNLNRKIVDMDLADYAPDSMQLLDAWDEEFEQQQKQQQQKKEEVASSSDISSTDDDSEEENWEIANHPSFEYRPASTPLAAGDDDEEKEFDVQFTDEELLALFNLPPTTKLVSKLPAITDAPSTASNPTKNGRTSATSSRTSSDDGNTDDKPVENNIDPNDPASSEPIDPIEAALAALPMPRLRAAHHSLKQPQVSWQQNASVICLTIEAPDVTAYRLEVTNRVLRYHANSLGHDRPLYCLLHLFAPIATEYTSHQQRGLVLRVRLVKLLRGAKYAWPRLVQQTARLAWLRYDVDAICGVATDGQEQNLLRQPALQQPPSNRLCRYRAFSETSSDSSDGGDNGQGPEDEMFNEIEY